jgi:ribonuclease HI
MEKPEEFKEVSAETESRTAAEKEYGQEWTPWKWLEKESTSMTIYLNALPSGLYRNGEGGWLVATDGSLRKNPITKLVEVMGAGAAWQHDRLPRVSTRIGGRLSSTRAELAAVDLVLDQMIQREENEGEMKKQEHMTILIDSSAALGRLRWFKRRDFKPANRKIKDFDILKVIVQKLKQREDAGAITRFVKVTGHTGEPLHAIADKLATTGAATEPKEGEVLPYQPPLPPTDLIFEFSTIQTQKVVKQPWGQQIAQRIKKTAAWEKWEKRNKETRAASFHQADQAGRGILGEAIKGVGSWALRGWIKSLTPYQYPVNQSFNKWNKAESARCECGAAVESISHVQLSCTLEARRKTRQSVHNKMMKVIQESVEHEQTETRSSIWDTEVKSLFPNIRQQGDVQDLIDRWRKGPSQWGQEEEFELWHRQMTRRWKAQRTGAHTRMNLMETRNKRSKDMGILAEEVGEIINTDDKEKTTILVKTTDNAAQAQARARRIAAEKSAHAISGKRKRRGGEWSGKVESKWEYDRQDEDLQKLLPDGLILDKEKRVIYIVEGARTEDEVGIIKNVNIKKTERYKRLYDALRRARVGYNVKQLNFVMGMRGTIQEDKWRKQLHMLGLKDVKIEKIIKKCMIVSIEGMQEVMWNSKHQESEELRQTEQNKVERSTDNQRRKEKKEGIG